MKKKLNMLNVLNILILVILFIIFIRFLYQIQIGDIKDSPSSIIKQWITVLFLTLYLIMYNYNEKKYKIILTLGLIAILLLIMGGHYTMSITYVKGDTRNDYKDIYDYEKKEFISTKYKILNYIGGTLFILSMIIFLALFKS